jgi:hypothetical protein
MSILKPAPLTQAAFAAFGDVIEMAGHDPITINQGYAQRFNDLAGVDVSMEGGTTNVSLLASRGKGPRHHARSAIHSAVRPSFPCRTARGWYLSVLTFTMRPAIAPSRPAGAKASTMRAMYGTTHCW